jgi:hypothetical protein
VRSGRGGEHPHHAVVRVLAAAALLGHGLAGLFGGAFLAAWFAPSRPLLHASVVGAVDAAVTFGVLSAGATLTAPLLFYGAAVLPAALAAGSFARWVQGPQRKRLGSYEAPKLLDE